MNSAVASIGENCFVECINLSQSLIIILLKVVDHSNLSNYTGIRLVNYMSSMNVRDWIQYCCMHI